FTPPPPPKKNKGALGVQVDLLFDREDGVITLCEIKYTDKLFVLDKSQAKIVMNKIEAFETYFSTKKQLHLALITTNGLKPTAWSEDLIHNVVTLTDFFRF
ncbi:MAG TPA: hypothetical protein VHK67_03620, partial [Rhabdochlamydiaceae bacterium]|nr:hypothetical protein [Rhabdochlamydiaceae bacterium]